VRAQIKNQDNCKSNRRNAGECRAKLRNRKKVEKNCENRKRRHPAEKSQQACAQYRPRLVRSDHAPLNMARVIWRRRITSGPDFCRN
jgi:hypothetical protein